MAMATGSGPKSRSMNEPNMTPMIDVLLVLLVIFILAQQVLQRSIDVGCSGRSNKDDLTFLGWGGPRVWTQVAGSAASCLNHGS